MRSGENTASAMPCAGSWSKLMLAVPKARSRSATTTSEENRLDTVQATLCASVEEPTPPLAPMKATERPSGSAAGSTKIEEMTDRMSAIETGATTYSEMPKRISSRYSHTSL